jgi:hypothetical protein
MVVVVYRDSEVEQGGPDVSDQRGFASTGRSRLSD